MKSLATLVLACILLAGCNGQGRPKVDEDQVYQDYLVLGPAYMRNGEYQRAKSNLNRAHSINPRSSEVHGLFGMLFQLEGELELAEEHFRSALRYDSKSIPTRNNFGAFLFDQERYAKAAEHLGVAAHDLYYSDRPQVFENLGVSFLRLGRADDAEQAFERAVALNPLQPRALIELADLRFSKQDYVNSQSLFTRYIQGFDQTAQSLWLEVRLARIFGAEDEEASYGFVLKNIFPASDQYTRYRESISE